LPSHNLSFFCGGLEMSRAKK